MALCTTCGQDMKRATGCTQVPVVRSTDSATQQPTPFGSEQRYVKVGLKPYEPGERCHDCLAAFGKFHHPGCDVEECPFCGRQLISCDCAIEER